jgi:hypothetical protein
MSQNPEVPIRKYIKFSENDFSGYWFDAYGWIACYFAQLEGLSYALIDALGANDSKIRLKKLQFQERTEQAKVLVCAHLRLKGEQALADEWDEFLTEARAAAPLRNKILHNPMSINLAQSGPLHDPEAGIVLVHESGQPILKLGAVQEFANRVTGLNLRMNELLARSQLIQSSNPNQQPGTAE